MHTAHLFLCFLICLWQCCFCVFPNDKSTSEKQLNFQRSSYLNTIAFFPCWRKPTIKKRSFYPLYEMQINHWLSIIISLASITLYFLWLYRQKVILLTWCALCVSGEWYIKGRLFSQRRWIHASSYKKARSTTKQHSHH